MHTTATLLLASCYYSFSKRENGRGERIRTSDLTIPNRARYQAALRPEFSTFASMNRALICTVVIKVCVMIIALSIKN